MEKSSENIRMNKRPQIAGAIIVSLVWLTLGTMIGFATIAIPQLRMKNRTISSSEEAEIGSPIIARINVSEINDEINNEGLYLDAESESWFAAANLLAGIPFTPVGGLLGGILGRRKIILFCQPFGLLSWLIMANAQNVSTLLIARFLSSVAICCQASPGVYTAETVHPKIRNNLTILPSIFVGLGMLFVWIIGYLVTWRITAYILALPNILIFLCLLLLPESPYWLIEANKIDLAEKSLRFFRGPNYDITEEIEEIKEKRKSKMENQGEKTSAKQTFNKILSKSFLKPFSCVGILFIFSEWSGYNAYLNYMIEVLETSGFDLDPRIGPIIVGSIRLFFAGMVPFFVGKIKPKILFVIAQTITTLAILTICIYSFIRRFYGTTLNDEIESSSSYATSNIELFSWIPLVGIIIINVLRGAGIEPVIHILLNEMFPTEIRTLAIGITQSGFLLSGFTSVKMFPTLKESLGLDGTCLLYSLISFFVILWGAYTIPDNRGKSLVKVEENITKIMKSTIQVKDINMVEKNLIIKSNGHTETERRL